MGNAMLTNLLFERLRTSALAGSIVALTACGGGGLSSDSPSSVRSTAAQAQAASAQGLLTSEASSASSGSSSAKGNSRGREANSSDYHPTRVLAKLVDATPSKTANASAKAAAFSSMGLRQMTGFASPALQGKQSSLASPLGNIAVFEITDPTLSVPEAVAQLQRSGLVVYAEPDYYMRQRVAPNDPSYGIYWHLKNTGQIDSRGFSGVIGNDINAEIAWNTTTGNGNVVVAVMDSGVMYDHPDLAPNMWSSAGTPRAIVPGDPSGVAGVVDDLNGANLAIDRGADTTIRPYAADPRSDHGTMVSGFVAARGNNSVGGSGVSWNAKIMGIKIEGPSNPGAAANSSFVNGIRYMIAKKSAGVNVRVMNISYGGAIPSQAYKDALEEANAAGILVVTAAGNDGSNDERTVGYPSGYKTPNLISVGALDRFNARASFSNYGYLVHLFAPGAEVPTTSSLTAPTTNGYIAANYRYTNGTSFASPIVAGAAALLMMQHPTESIAQIKARLLNSTTPFLTRADSLVGGKLNLAAAIAAPVACTSANPVISEIPSQLTQGATHKISVFLKTCTNTGSVSLTIAGIETQLKDDGVYPDEYANDGYYGGSFKTDTSPSNVQMSIAVKDTSGNGFGAVTTFRPLTQAVSYAQTTQAYTWDAPTAAQSVKAVLTDQDDGVLVLNTGAVTPALAAFNFDGRPRSTIYMSVNGYVCLDDINCVSSLYFPLPSGKVGKPLGTTQALLAPWWNDWIATCPSSNLYVALLGTAPNRRLVLTWENVHQYYNGITCASATNGVSFQMALFENQNVVEFRYQDVSSTVPAGVANPSSGALGSAGVQQSGGRRGTQLFYDSATGVSASTAFRFAPSSPSFTDVPAGQFFTTSIEGLRGSRITLGCVAGVQFCPNDQTTQEQMAAFMARAILGHDKLADYTVYPSSGFTDVFTSFVPYVNFLSSRGIMTGTGSDPNKFCITNANNCSGDFVTRAQMARYLVKAARGGSFVPPPASGAVFTDVPASHPEGAYIEELIRMKITNGTSATTYGPSDLVSRAQMATFLQRTFRPFDQH